MSYQLPNVIDNPPEEYDCLEQHDGLVSKEINLVINNDIHRLTVRHTLIDLNYHYNIKDKSWNKTVEIFMYNYCFDNKYTFEDIDKVLRQTVKFYEKYKKEYNSLHRLNEEYDFKNLDFI